MVETLTVGPLQTNCYVYSSGGEAMVVDAADEPQRIRQALAKAGLELRCLVNTHAHFDHIGALAALSESSGVAVLLHEEDIPLLRGGGILPPDVPPELLPPGFPTWMAQEVFLPHPPRPLRDGDEIAVGAVVFRVIHTPGHTPGSICLYCASESLLFSGDTLFHLGVGRADLPGGNGRMLLQSIKERLFTLPDNTVVYPGHGPSTTIGLEKRRNPFVRPVT